jgi:NTP pyrophosphatase (non-canonical NTP hydrolase)
MDDDLESLKARAIRFRDERDWAQFHRPKDLALGCAIEASELAELFLWKRDDEAQAALGDPAFRERLSDEMADVLMFLLYLSHASGVPLATAFEAKLAKNATKYPVEGFRGTARKYDAT